MTTRPRTQEQKAAEKKVVMEAAARTLAYEGRPVGRPLLNPVMPVSHAQMLRFELENIEAQLLHQHHARRVDGICTDTAGQCTCWVAKLMRRAEEAAMLPITD